MSPELHLGRWLDAGPEKQSLKSFGLHGLEELARRSSAPWVFYHLLPLMASRGQGHQP